MSQPFTPSAPVASPETGPRLLLIDADEAPRHALAGHLASHLRLVPAVVEGDGGGLSAPIAPVVVTESGSVPEALAALAGCPSGDGWDVVLLGAPNAGAARRAVRALRVAGLDPPVIAMIPPDGPGEDADTVAWPAGVTRTARPARLSTLVALLRAALAPPVDGTAAPADGFDLGPYACAPRARTLTDRHTGAVLALTEKEAAILACLWGADGPVSRDDLLARVWGYGDSIDTHTLETHIHRLRRKIEPDPRQPALLITDTDGGGYRLAVSPS
ncbi:winged helix-turn-helix domain-containing protein [Roseospira visakhapatnamensis]|uniref:DNA-binding response OmpR family regulator n=1 Tax=Roseospira visakhapatnamensis TaxID=390880 RepID=A0A7W6W9G8_9PROT|nr:winged helix-turn-helix domain-containing protein [Roseospira visakhapatnamensis]MBB4265442.1 DNA-binding response OmpR family regulator [Roseospira visakhapatnamensis]